MGDCDRASDRAYYCAAAGESATIASLRHAHCDCAIELRHRDSAQGGVTRIEAHRAVLARATYFAALFKHADPTRVERENAKGERALCAVYSIEAPFRVDSIVFLVECLYAPDHADGVGDCDDPVDVVKASLFAGMPAYCTDNLVKAVLARLCAAHGEKSRETGESLCALVRHLLCSDIDRDVRIATMERTLGLLPETDRDAIAVDHADLLPPTYYKPEAAVGDPFTDEDGRRWRTLRIAVDHSGPADASEITWQGLVFKATLHFIDYEDPPTLSVLVSCAPEGETLGAWPYGSPVPDGTIDTEPRAVRIKARAYHPMRGSRVGEGRRLFFAGMDAQDQQAERHAARGRALPKGTVLAPYAFNRLRRSAGRVARNRQSVLLGDDYDYGTEAMRSLVACEVEIQVEEIDP